MTAITATHRGRTWGLLLLAAAAAGLVVWGALGFRRYGWGVFVMLPFGLGFAAALVEARAGRARIGGCVKAALLSCLLTAVVLVVTAFEGLFCLLMAAPLALGVAALGGVLGWVVQRAAWDGFAALALVPLVMTIEGTLAPPARQFAVRTEVTVAAPPETVWRNVVAFPALPPPEQWYFRHGIAYPVRAEIEGEGVGAVRRCHFSTGPFVEPITEWDAPRLLRFAVTANPRPMRELTLYQGIDPPHLDGFLASEQGQFRLEALPGGRTRLEGTTWYRHHLFPETYWRWWSDAIIHRIHLRVLRHIATLAEADTLHSSR